MGTLKEKFKRALVTGSSSGLGLAITRHLLEEGVEVVGMSRSPELPDSPESYHPWPIDLSRVDDLRDALERVFARFPDIDLVVNNAGFGVLEHLQDQSELEIEAQLNVMLVAPTIIARRSLRLFDARATSGCLCNVSSLAVELPLPLMSVYNVCKGGLSALSQSLMLDASGAGKGYRIIDFRPGDFNTSFAERMRGQAHWNGVNLRMIMDRHHASAPDEAVAVRAFHRALLSNHSETVRTGDFFQSKVAPVGARILSHRFLRRIIRAYYTR